MRSTRANNPTGRRRLPRGGRLLPTAADRAGSVLIAVLWLMALLWVLGIFFFLFANTEQTSSQYYADAAKVDNRCGVDTDVLWDWALRQIIVGPSVNEDGDDDPSTGYRDSEQESALYGFEPSPNNLLGYDPSTINPFNLGPHSILRYVLGKDLQAYNGAGINLITDSTGQPLVDLDHDGVADADQTLLNWNYSAAASNGAVVNMADRSTWRPTMDGGYTYPDINAPFLAYFAPDPLDPTTQIFIPSYHRPQYLRNGSGPITGWDADAGTTQRIFRPHVNHMSVDSSGTPYPRYFTGIAVGADGAPGAVNVDDDGDGNVDYLDPPTNSMPDPEEMGWPGTDDVLSFPFTNNAALLPDGATPNPSKITFQEGIWTGGAGPYTYNYDVKAAGLHYVDGTGTTVEIERDAIWMDLGFPVQECDGQLFKPLFGITIFDADGLLNVNLAGNTAGAEIKNSVSPLLNTFNRSNQALAPGELSLQYLFNAMPSSVPPGDQAWEPYKQFFGIDPTTINAQNLANMETWFLLHGRGDYDASAVYQGEVVGRYGEQTLLKSLLMSGNPAFAPQAGATNVDDDRDNSDFTSTGIGNFASNDPRNLSTVTQPLDIRGAGQMIATNGTQANRPDVGAGPNRWVQYLDYDVDSAFFPYANAYPLLMAWTPPNAESIPFNVDEADEIVLLDGFPDRSANDATFSVDEMAALHGSTSDPGIDSLTSRLRELLPISLEEATNADSIRKQLTTISWDRIEFALQSSLSNHGRPWEWSNNFPPQARDGAGNLIAESSAPVQTQPFRLAVRNLFNIARGNTNQAAVGLQRRLDLNRHLYINNANQLAYRELTPHPSGAADPGSAPIPTAMPAYPPTTAVAQEYWARRDRQEKARDIYVMLYMLCGGLDTTVGADGQPGVALTDDDGINGTDDIGELGWPGSDDISYLKPNTDGDSDGQRDLYSDVQLRQMAQFAVNVVDALDSDNVITKFEYDLDLSNGWHRDDNPYIQAGAAGDQDNPSFTSDFTELSTTKKAVVYGVEAQQLTFSEALFFRADHVESGGVGQEHDATLHNDKFDRLFTYLELRNASPLPVNTGAQLPNSQSQLGRHWRIRIETTDPVTSVLDPGRNILTLSAGQIPAGGLFTIGSNSSPTTNPMFTDPNYVMTDLTDPMNPLTLPTELWVDTVFTGTLGTRTRIIPRATAPNLNLDLSLVQEDTISPISYRINAGDVSGAIPVAGVWDNVTAVDPGGWLNVDDRPEVTFVLERRANLNRTAPLVATNATGQQEEFDNPWVEVDRIVADRKTFHLQDQGTATNPMDVQTQLAKLVSYERNQPIAFTGATTDPDARYSNVHTAGIFSNSIGQDNESTLALPNGFAGWQPHFDRHFASIMELLSIPLYGPGDVTAHVLRNDLNQSGTENRLNGMGILLNGSPLLTFPLTAPDRVRRRVAQEMFLFPDHDQNPATPPTKLDNRWHRLFSFVEIPSKLHRGLGDVTRVPGKINLNTVRNAGVLGAAIDATRIHNLNLVSLDGTDTGSVSTTASRNWWQEFVAARDAVYDSSVPGNPTLAGGNGRDPVTGRYVPGVAGTRPFRDLSYVDDGNTSIDHTVLRKLLADVDGRGLFEVGAGDGSATTDNTVDYYMRQRLLSKVANQTTTRSHVYIAFIACDFFEVVEPNPGQRQIGAKLPTSPGHRGFFIIDVSDPLGNGAYSPGTGGLRGRFDFRKFVRYRRTIE